VDAILSGLPGADGQGTQVATKLRVGALCFSRGKQRFSVAGKSSIIIVRFSAGTRNPTAEPNSDKSAQL
jgi:hypothetical protein